MLEKMVALAGNGLIFPILGFASCIAFIYMSFGDLGSNRVETKLGFVERNGINFIVDGRPLYVNGWNSYWLMDQAVEVHSRHRVEKMFRVGKKMGLTVCRTWAFNDGAYNALQVSLGRFDERVFKGLDWVIAEARKNGIRLILALANNLPAFGGKAQYAKWAWEDGISLTSSNDSFFFDPSIRSYFKVYIKTLLTRKNHVTGIEYRDDPTIFAWELMNEPRCPSDRSGDTFQEWLEEMAGYVKSLDKKHLLTLGFEGFYGPTSSPEKRSINPTEWCSTLGSDFIRNSKVSTLDFTSVHVYPDQWFLHKEYDFDDNIKYVSTWINSHIDDGDKELGKPVLFTEFGFSNKNKGFDHSQRDSFYGTVFDILYESARRNGSGAGSFIWQMMVEGMDQYNDEYGIVPGQRPSLYMLIKQQSCRMVALSQKSTKRISFC